VNNAVSEIRIKAVSEIYQERRFPRCGSQRRSPRCAGRRLPRYE
jgi:hypothetical protein